MTKYHKSISRIYSFIYNDYRNFLNYWYSSDLPLESLSTKLIAPYTKALDSTFFPISWAVMDRLVISIPDPPDPIDMAIK